MLRVRFNTDLLSHNTKYFTQNESLILEIIKIGKPWEVMAKESAFSKLEYYKGYNHIKGRRAGLTALAGNESDG